MPAERAISNPLKSKAQCNALYITEMSLICVYSNNLNVTEII